MRFCERLSYGKGESSTTITIGYRMNVHSHSRVGLCSVIHHKNPLHMASRGIFRWR